MDRYSGDVLSPGWGQRQKPKVHDLVMAVGRVLEVDGHDFVGAIVGWENGLVVLEDRRNRRRSFPISGQLYHCEGYAVKLIHPPRQGSSKPLYTPSGSRAGQEGPKVALPSRIYVEGRHDAELVEKIWGDDLRHVGVVVEFMGGMDDLVDIVDRFRPRHGRRLGVLLDHLVAGSKETAIAQAVERSGYGDHVMITGHRFIDVWHAILPATLGIPAWPQVPRGEDFKIGTLKRLGLAHKDQTDVANAWQAMCKRVRSYRDLDPAFNREVERLIDFVTQDQPGAET